MKKTFKKISVLLVALVLLMSIVPMQSFAAEDFDVSDLNLIKDIKFSEDSFQTVSMKAVENYFDGMAEYYNEYLVNRPIGIFLYPTVEDFLNEHTYTCSSYDSLGDYEYEITLRSGRKITYTDDEDCWLSPLIGIYSVNAEISYADYLAAKQNGAEEIPVTFETDYMIRKIGYISVKDNPNVYTSTVKVVPCFVESITAVSGVPTAIPKDSEPALDGAQFIIVYADGKVRIAAVEETIKDYDAPSSQRDHTPMISYELAGREIDPYVNDGEEGGTPYLEFSFCDEEFTQNVEVLPSPFEKIEIIECDLDTFFGLRSITYKITWKNGESKEYTRKLTGWDSFYDWSNDINIVDRYIVEISDLPLGFDDDESVDFDPEKTYVNIQVADCEDAKGYDIKVFDMYGILDEIRDLFYNLERSLESIFEALPF